MSVKTTLYQSKKYVMPSLKVSRFLKTQNWKELEGDGTTWEELEPSRTNWNKMELHPVQVPVWPFNFAPGTKTKFKEFSGEIQKKLKSLEPANFSQGS